MRCCTCKNKLSLAVTLRGEGACLVCNQQQIIAKKYTFTLVISIVLVFVLLGISLISILTSLVLGFLYLAFSKTEPINGD